MHPNYDYKRKFSMEFPIKIILEIESPKPRTPIDMDGTLHTDFSKSETNRDIRTKTKQEVKTFIDVQMVKFWY